MSSCSSDDQVGELLRAEQVEHFDMFFLSKLILNLFV